MSETNATRPQIRVCHGGIPRRWPAATRPRLTLAETEERTEQISKARMQAMAGNDAALRSLIDSRYAVECFSELGGPYGEKLPGGQYSRKRKFSNPLFLTPYGLLEAYPERDADLFVDCEAAQRAVHALQRGGQWEVRETLLTMEMSRKSYLRWFKEVKGKVYAEPRRSLADQAEIYRQGGRAALRALYTASHVSKIISKLRSEGFPMWEEDKNSVEFGAPR